MNIPERIVDKMFSGRFLLIVSVAFVFVWCSIDGVLTADTIEKIVTNAMTFYFTKAYYDNKRTKTGGD